MIRVIAAPAIIFDGPPIMVVRLVFGDDVNGFHRGSVIANYHPDDLRELELVLELGQRYVNAKG